MRDAVLSKALTGSDSLLKKLAMVVFGVLAVGIAAQAEVPMFPVPMTLQTLAISVIGLTYGARMAALTLVAYLAAGAVGMPVFAGGSAGFIKLMGPTAGFLWGFIAMAYITGWLVERGLSRGILRLFVAAFIPSMLLFVPGVLVLWAVLPSLDLNGALNAGAYPFLVGGVVKSLIAALIVAGGWAALKSRKNT